MIKTFVKIVLLSVLAIGILYIWYFHIPAQHKEVFPSYDNWDHGQVRHILPAANHNQLLIKVSFEQGLEHTPLLSISDSMTVQGASLEPQDKYWEFDVHDLTPNTSYSLLLHTAEDTPLADSWSIKTFPHPDSTIEEVTIFAFTCAGGVTERVLNKELFLPTEYRHLLLEKGLGYNPDIVIANGDHIYWDRQTMDKSLLKRLVKRRLDNLYGKLNLTAPMDKGENLETITRIADAQIAELYGCLLRSTPTYFVPDDHDLFENDEAHHDLVTLPPMEYGVEAHQTVQNLYYPEFLPDKNRPLNLLGQKEEVNRNYGTLRYGNLVEGLLYDCKGHTTLDDDHAVLVSQDAEDWISNRTINSQAEYVIHIPSTPIAWTAGKWSEWYPDVFQDNRQIGVGDVAKYGWQKGWWHQHQRMIGSWLKSKHMPVVLQGDLHNSSYSLIQRSGGLDFSKNPIHAIGTGTLGSGSMGFPSAFRGTPAVIPENIDAEVFLQPTEKNGFSIIRITIEKITISMFTWRPEDGTEAITQLEPVLVREIVRPRQGTKL